MFEKEAKEYCNTLIRNKIKVKSIYDIEVIQKDLEKLFQQSAEFGYNKANEWHCLTKDPNDLPKEQGQYLVLADFFGKYYDVMTESEVKMHSEHIIKWCKLPKE